MPAPGGTELPSTAPRLPKHPVRNRSCPEPHGAVCSSLILLACVRLYVTWDVTAEHQQVSLHVHCLEPHGILYFESWLLKGGNIF